MKVIEFYKIIEKRFPGNLSFAIFSNPIFQPNMGVQFTNEYGCLIGKPINNPIKKIVSSPFIGPFYESDIIGIGIIVNEKRIGKYKKIVFIVKYDRKYYFSASLNVKMSIKELKGLIMEFGIKLYSLGSCEPCESLCECLNLNDLISFEREKYNEWKKRQDSRI